MKKHFKFVNIAGGIYHDVTNAVVSTAYNQNAAAA
jgi:hypothetical protein